MGELDGCSTAATKAGMTASLARRLWRRLGRKPGAMKTGTTVTASGKELDSLIGSSTTAKKAGTMEQRWLLEAKISIVRLAAVLVRRLRQR